MKKRLAVFFLSIMMVSFLQLPMAQAAAAEKQVAGVQIQYQFAVKDGYLDRVQWKPYGSTSETVTGNTYYQDFVQVGKSDLLPPTAADTQPQYYIESQDPEIQKTALELVKDVPSRDVKKRLDVLANYVIHNMKYDYSNTTANKGALSAYQKHSGVCEDYSDLLIAMLRVNGIPARPVVGGFVKSPTEIILHQWVEVWLEDKWVQIEPQGGWSYRDGSIRMDDIYSVTSDKYISYAYGLSGSDHAFYYWFWGSGQLVVKLDQKLVYEGILNSGPYGTTWEQ